MARVPVMAAGGIVLRRQQPPLVAVVRLRKRDEWVLPKGKLDEGETPRAAARREVLDEPGYNVTVHEFCGTLVYDSGGRSKIVHYWRMEAAGEQARELMNDVRAVDWLPLDAAVERLSRTHEQAFLANVGPQALSAFARRPKAKAPASRKRRGQPAEVSEPTLAAPILVPQPPDLMPEPAALAESAMIADDAAVAEEMLIFPAEPEIVFPAEPEIVEASAEMAADPAMPIASKDAGDNAFAAADRQRRSLAQKVRDWLGRAA